MPGDSAPLVLDPDRLLPADTATRDIARRLHEAVRAVPIVSPHGHVDPRLLLDDRPFTEPVSLLVTADHYVTRLLHADGLPLDGLGVGRPLDAGEARTAWRSLCDRWTLFAGTPVRLWLEAQLVDVFSVTLRPSAETADTIYDEIAACLADAAFSPRALYDRFAIDVLATTDDPCSDLSAHAALATDPGFSGRVIPTFRPDAYLEPARPEWPDAVTRLGEAADVDTGSYAGYIRALEERRRTFVAHGGRTADHAHADAGTEPLDATEAARIYAAALSGTATTAESTAFRRHMVFQMARMSCDDGLVMTFHPGVRRGHHRPSLSRYGPDTGHDIPVRLELTDALRPLLDHFGTHPGFHLVVFTVDETVWSRELAPLAGFYPAVYAGVPWWFLDAPDAIRRFRSAVTETAGFFRTSGFVDDTRAFCSIPARHDMARRVDAGFLARLVVEHRLDEDEAADILVQLVTAQPVRVFKL